MGFSLAHDELEDPHIEEWIRFLEACDLRIDTRKTKQRKASAKALIEKPAADVSELIESAESVTVEISSARQKHTYKLTHARQDPAHALARGLFLSYARGEREKHKLKATYTTTSETLVEFTSFEPLGPDDLRVLVGLIAIAGLQKTDITKVQETEVANALYEDMSITTRAEDFDIRIARGSFRMLAREIGYVASGTNLEAIKQSIERLLKVSVLCTNGTKSQGYHLISRYRREGDGFIVALNPRISRAIINNDDQSFVRISLDIVRQIKNDAALLLYYKLSASVWPGETRQLTIEKIVEYIFLKENESQTNKYMRKNRAKAAFLLLNKIGWNCKVISDTHVQVTRPRTN